MEYSWIQAFRRSFIILYFQERNISRSSTICVADAAQLYQARSRGCRVCQEIVCDCGTTRSENLDEFEIENSVKCRKTSVILELGYSMHRSGSTISFNPFNLTNNFSVKQQQLIN